MGPASENLVLDPLAVLHLDNRLHIMALNIQPSGINLFGLPTLSRLNINYCLDGLTESSHFKWLIQRKKLHKKFDYGGLIRGGRGTKKSFFSCCNFYWVTFIKNTVTILILDTWILNAGFSWTMDSMGVWYSNGQAKYMTGLTIGHFGP